MQRVIQEYRTLPKEDGRVVEYSHSTVIDGKRYAVAARVSDSDIRYGTAPISVIDRNLRAQLMRRIETDLYGDAR